MIRAFFISIIMHVALAAAFLLVLRFAPQSEAPRLEVESVELSLDETQPEAPGGTVAPEPDMVLPPEDAIRPLPDIADALTVPEPSPLVLPPAEIPPDSVLPPPVLQNEPPMPEIRQRLVEKVDRKAPELEEKKKVQIVRADDAPGGGRTAKVLSNPRPRGEIRPEYPRSARSRGAEGSVILEVAVGADGRVKSCRVLQSSGHGDLDESARKAAGKARFIPAKSDGMAIDGIFKLKLTFRLK